jgi:hypothetical protein
MLIFSMVSKKDCTFDYALFSVSLLLYNLDVTA